jgi:hypothetical protein
MTAADDISILLPMLCLIALTFGVLFRQFFTRVGYMKANKIHPQHIQNRDNSRQLLAVVAQPADNFNNLLELPPLFYLAAVLIWLLQLTDDCYLILAWSYVALRYLHSAIHLSYNRVMHRFAVFAVSCLVLLAIWLRLGWAIAGY